MIHIHGPSPAAEILIFRSQFIHQGLTFLVSMLLLSEVLNLIINVQVQEVSHDTKMAKLVRSAVNWITEPRQSDFMEEVFLAYLILFIFSRDFTNIDALQTHRIREIRNSPHRAFYGRTSVSLRVMTTVN